LVRNWAFDFIRFRLTWGHGTHKFGLFFIYFSNLVYGCYSFLVRAKGYEYPSDARTNPTASMHERGFANPHEDGESTYVYVDLGIREYKAKWLTGCWSVD